MIRILSAALIAAMHLPRRGHSSRSINQAIDAQIYVSYGQAQDSENYVCSDCWYTCSECDTIWEYEDNMLECCVDSRKIHNYSYRPTYKFYDMQNSSLVSSYYPKPNRIYMGFEIELVRASRLVDSFYANANENFDDPRFMYLKEDASISEQGVEFVTMPATLDAFELRFPWEAFDNLYKGGARGWGYESCGMYIHVNRSAFMPSHLYKFMKFQIENYDKCISFSGRHSFFGQWDNETMGEMGEDTGKFCKGYVSAERYSAINVTARTTIELRYFRSNITKDGIIRNAQWVDAIYEYTKQMSIIAPRAERWSWRKFTEFVKDNSRYSVMYEYLRRIECA
jgi:hypothetical protein